MGVPKNATGLDASKPLEPERRHHLPRHSAFLSRRPHRQNQKSLPGSSQCHRYGRFSSPRGSCKKNSPTCCRVATPIFPKWASCGEGGVTVGFAASSATRTFSCPPPGMPHATVVGSESTGVFRHRQQSPHPGRHLDRAGAPSEPASGTDSFSPLSIASEVGVVPFSTVGQPHKTREAKIKEVAVCRTNRFMKLKIGRFSPPCPTIPLFIDRLTSRRHKKRAPKGALKKPFKLLLSISRVGKRKSSEW